MRAYDRPPAAPSSSWTATFRTRPKSSTSSSGFGAQGHEVVYAVRTRRKENFFKRACYFVFYRLLRAISDIDIPLDSGDFCLMDRKVVDVLKHLPEQLRFIRGLRTFVGFRQIGLQYERALARRASRSTPSAPWFGSPWTGWSVSAAIRSTW